MLMYVFPHCFGSQGKGPNLTFRCPNIGLEVFNLEKLFLCVELVNDYEIQVLFFFFFEAEIWDVCGTIYLIKAIHAEILKQEKVQ